MRKILNRIIQWAMRGDEGLKLQGGLAPTVSRNESIPNCRIGVLKAMNGRVLELSTFKPNPHGPDWTTEMFIVPEDQTLNEAIGMLLTLKGMNQ